MSKAEWAECFDIFKRLSSPECIEVISQFKARSEALWQRLCEEVGNCVDIAELKEDTKIKPNNLLDITYDKERSILMIKLPKALAICEECGKVYGPVRKDQRFHCTKCRNRWNQREWRREHLGQKLAGR